MKRVVELISWASLVLIVVAPLLFYGEKITLETNKLLMTIATGIWFASAICWMGREQKG